MNNTTIEFINHASVLITHNNIGILSDPWYRGPVFHNGWRLIHENKETEIIKILEKTTHIYISHEHPDHFDVSFFNSSENIEILKKNSIKIIFQHTKDKRVINFLKSKGITVNEFKNDELVKLSEDVNAQIVKHDFYDSSLAITTPDAKILNLNDAPMRTDNEIKSFKNKYGNFDILLTQFSYAAWKGGKKNKSFREKAAVEKILHIEKQASILDCKTVIPFASFIYFSNELNFYMNDSINTPEMLKKYFSNKNYKYNVIFFKPGEVQEVSNLKQNDMSINFWNKEYQNLSFKQKDSYTKSVSEEDLNSQFTIYKNKIFKKNSKFLIYFLNKIKLFGLFQSINIYLHDHNKKYNYSILNGLVYDNSKKTDISMHSKSLSFIFKNEFGFDTLSVNGCFESSENGFSKSVKTLSIGSLNALGFNLGLNIFLKPSLIFLFFSKLKKIMNNIDD